ncbi:hypothetical protein Q31b_42320 [Novipirellula aureliae]|uniref:Chromosome partition protein Smc n=1 Tax=Novipirellula aureliae TaxID=2527966 RepID=A0A5C6DT95_9BACT|nr:hypothetical protein [Novipirellula aureliae]TWU39147.1 hypothetical protein Q31b_42320 [Novipirellula aureliae]
MSTTVSPQLDAARTIAAERESKALNEKAKQLELARKIAIAIVDEKRPPSPNEIVAACDDLGVSVDWMDECVNAYERRQQWHELQAEIQTVSDEILDNNMRRREARTQVDTLEKEHSALAHRIETSDFVGMSLEDKIAFHSKARMMRGECYSLNDIIRLRSAETKRLESVVEKLRSKASAIDPGSDPGSGLESPQDFALPAVR